MRIITLMSIALSFILSTSAFAKSVTELLQDLDSSERRIRRDAVRELSDRRYRNNNQIIAPLLNVILTDSNPPTREYAATALLNHRNAEVFPQLVQIATQEGNAQAQEGVVSAFSFSSSPRVKAPLLIALSSSDPAIRRDAARGLGSFSNDPTVRTALTNSLNSDPDARTRNYSARSIARTRSQQVAGILLDTLNNPQSLGRADAAEELGSLGFASAVPSLIAAMAESDRELQRNSIKSLRSFIGREEVVTALLNQYVVTTDRRNKDVLFEVLVESKDPRVMPIMLEVLESSTSSRYAKREAIKGLQNSGDKTVLMALAEFLGSTDESTRKDAYDAIMAIIKRLPRTQEVREALACLPSTSTREHKQGTKNAALLIDLMIPVLLGSFSVAAHNGYEIVGQLSPEGVAELQELFRRLQ